MMYKQDRSKGEARQEGGGRKNSAIEDIKEEITQMSNLSELDIEDIAKEGGYADRIGKDFKNRKDKDKIKTTQLRKFFDETKTLERKLKRGDKGWDYIKPDFYLLRPKLAYANARGLIPKDFFELLSECMKRVDTSKNDDKQKEKNYKRFVTFLEAIVAYFKYHNPKSN
jgi:CRISPR-associated protein Csm2